MKSFLLTALTLLILQSATTTAQQTPVRILVVYHSDTGNTEKLAQSIRDGGKSVQGVEITLQKMTDVKEESLSNFDGILVGTPVHWANLSTESRRFGG